MSESITIAAGDTIPDPDAPSPVADTPIEDETERPEWLPEKFKTPEDMAKAYGELESKVGKPADTEADADADEVDDAANKAVESAGLNMEALRTEFADKGELSEDSLKSLEAAGITKDVVDKYVEGQQALAAQQEQSTAEVKAIAGDDGAYDQMVDWASKNLTGPEQSAYNAAVDSGNLESVKAAVRDLKARWSADVGSPASKNFSGPADGNRTDVYESSAQAITDMSNPKYDADPAFRAKVDAKIGRSNIL